MKRRALLLGVLAAAVILSAFGFLAQRSLLAVRLEAENSLRRRLTALATENAALVEQRIQARLRRAAEDGTSWRIGPDGIFERPAEPIPFESLDLPEDTPTELVLMIEDAERMENREDEEEAAASLYRLAAQESEDPAVRRLVLFRLAALESRRGNQAEAVLVFTEVVPLVGDTELLLLAATEGAPVSPTDLAGSFVRHLGLKGSSVAEGYLRLLGMADHPEVKARLTELELMAALRPMARNGDPERQTCYESLPADRCALLGGDDILVLTRSQLRSGLPTGTILPDEEPAREGRSEILIAVTSPGGFVISARADLREIDQTVRRQGLLLGAATVVAVVAGFIAIFALLRGVHRKTELARLKSEFVANVSHELRTPLSVIRLYAETLKNNRVPPGEEQEYAAIIDREAAALTGLVDRVLAFSGIDRGTRVYRLESGDVREFLLQTAGDAEDHYPELKLSVETPDQPCRAAFDAQALTIAVGNLIDNAMKHGGGAATLRLLADGPGMLRIEVEDRGPGVPEDERDRLFDRFHRGRRASDLGVRGSGLGLALVQHSAEGHGGQAGFQATPGEGSIFYITIPLEEGP